MSSRSLLGVSLISLLCLSAVPGCAPDRGNNEGGVSGSSEVAWFVTRQGYGGGGPLWGMLFVPRDDEHDCNALLNYDWSDLDGDFIRVEFSLGQDLDWEGDFSNYEDPVSCGDWWDPSRRCFGAYDYRPGEEVLIYPAASTLEIRRYDESLVTGTLESEDTDRVSFSATHCGEMPYYYFVGDSEPSLSDRRRSVSTEARQSGGWGLRFR